MIKVIGVPSVVLCIIGDLIFCFLRFGYWWKWSGTIFVIDTNWLWEELLYANSLPIKENKNLYCLCFYARNTAVQYHCNQDQLTQTTLLKKFTQLIANDATQLQSRVRAFKISCAVVEISYLFSKFNHGVRIELTVRYLAAGPLLGSTLYQLASWQLHLMLHNWWWEIKAYIMIHLLVFDQNQACKKL